MHVVASWMFWWGRWKWPQIKLTVKEMAQINERGWLRSYRVQLFLFSPFLSCSHPSPVTFRRFELKAVAVFLLCAVSPSRTDSHIPSLAQCFSRNYSHPGQGSSPYPMIFPGRGVTGDNSEEPSWVQNSPWAWLSPVWQLYHRPNSVPAPSVFSLAFPKCDHRNLPINHVHFK